MSSGPSTAKQAPDPVSMAQTAGCLRLSWACRRQAAPLAGGTPCGSAVTALKVGVIVPTSQMRAVRPRKCNLPRAELESHSCI